MSTQDVNLVGANGCSWLPGGVVKFELPRIVGLAIGDSAVPLWVKFESGVDEWDPIFGQGSSDGDKFWFVT